MTNSPAKVWFAIDVVADRNAAEAIEFAFNELDSLGTEIDSLGKAASEHLLITGFFDELPEDGAVNQAVSDAIRIYCLSPEVIHSVVSRTVEETDWLAEWKKYWKPTEIGRFTIAPPWEIVDEASKIVITIEPNMAFGTGTHETTQLCVMAIDQHYTSGQSFLDVGTGTGILAIAAAKLSAGPAIILACDTDDDSVRIARENAASNGVGERIAFRGGSIEEETPVFDFVAANLTIDVILPILPLLLAKSRNFLLLSGILAEQKRLICDELLSSGISTYQIESAGEWISVLVKRD